MLTDGRIDLDGEEAFYEAPLVLNHEGNADVERVTKHVTCIVVGKSTDVGQRNRVSLIVSQLDVGKDAAQLGAIDVAAIEVGGNISRDIQLMA